MKKTLLALSLSCFMICTACVHPWDDDDGGDGGSGGGGGGGGGGGTAMVTCYDNIRVDLLRGLGDTDSNPVIVKAWLAGNNYGINNFFIFKLDVSGDEESPEYYYAGTDRKVEARVPEEGYEIPDRLWSAGRRMNLDGLDPYKFNEVDPFYLGYVPFTFYVPWKSSNGVENIGVCPGKVGFDSMGRPMCLYVNELDPNSPILENGQTYLIRMFFGGKVNYNDIGNWVMTCNQAIFTYDESTAIEYRSDNTFKSVPDSFFSMSPEDMKAKKRYEKVMTKKERYNLEILDVL